jgi:hypothetical protein
MRRRKGGSAIPRMIPKSLARGRDPRAGVDRRTVMHDHALLFRARGGNQGEAMCNVRIFAAALLLLLPATAQAQDALARARAECEAKLQIPRVPGSGDSVREMQTQTCVQDKLREQPAQPASSRQRR